MFRAYLISFLFVIYLILVLPLTLFGFLLAKISPKVGIRIAMAIASFASNLFFIIAGSKVHVEGIENLPKDDTVLFIGNHKSYLDIPLLLKVVPFPISFIAKSDLKKVPVLSLVMTLLGCLFIERDNLRQSLSIIKQGIKQLQDGDSMVIFPEGTRSKTDGFLPFKQGSLKLAEKADVPVIPFAVKGTDQVFGKHGFRVKPYPVYITFGPAIDLKQLSEEDKKRSSSFIQKKVEDMFSEISAP